MRAPFSIPLLVTVTAILLGGIAVMATADVDITKNGTKRCITSDGLPNHDTGAFLNRDNPHRISAQNVSVCVPTNPQKGSTPQEVRVPGIAINGVKIRPGTAYFYDASTPPSHSRNPASGWNLDGMGGRTTLGLDIQNAHVGPEGDYHCHGMPPALTRTSGDALTGLKFVMLGQTHGPAICCCPALGPRHPVVYTTVPIMRIGHLSAVPEIWTYAMVVSQTATTNILPPRPIRFSPAAFWEPKLPASVNLDQTGQAELCRL